jgi:hypothetical protein
VNAKYFELNGVEVREMQDTQYGHNEVAHFTRTQNSLGLNNNDTGFHSLLGFGI